MQRAHRLNVVKDITFVDSTASCDSQDHLVTFMLTACGIGAVPLAVMITKGQLSDNYIVAFNLLKEAVPLVFCSQGYLLQFITNDSEAERQALQYVWPDSKSLLCRFHISQSRKELWCIAFRDKSMHGHHTKNIMLQLKSNLQQLVEEKLEQLEEVKDYKLDDQ
ncbi:hypothetical protein QTP88_000471 [Uroleucon formosanum]